MTDTANLGLPFIEGSQAQKHVTHNEALRILDAAIQIAVLDLTRTAPPSSPAAGERHVVATGATGAWAGHANAIATWQDGAWAFLVPHIGWCIWSVADVVMFVFDGTVWRDLRNLAVDNLAHLGINTTASSPNLLGVKSNAALFAAINAADGGSGDVRLQLSKESAAKTASVFFSDAFSGRAEFGLVGSDAFKLKVSADGSAWLEAFTIDQSSGNLALPRGLALTGVISPPQITANQNDYNPAGVASASVLQLSSDAARSVSGLAGGAEGRIVGVINTGSQPITLLDESASSTAANRFTLGGDLVIPAKQAAVLRYDGTAARWQALARPAAGTLLAANNLSDLAAASTARANLGVRDVLAANRTYYVRTDGSNANTGLSNTSGGAFLTIQKAIDVVAALDIRTFNVTIAVGAGTYAGSVLVNGPWLGSGVVTISGDITTPSNVLVSTSGVAITAANGAAVSLQGLKLQSTASFAAIVSSQNAVITLSGKNEFGSTPSGHDIFADNGTVIAGSAEILSGTSGGAHYQALDGGFITSQNATWSTSGTAVRSVFAQAQAGGTVLGFGSTFTGTYSCQRYNASLNGAINSNGGGASYFPGSSAGSTATGGQYA